MKHLMDMDRGLRIRQELPGCTSLNRNEMNTHVRIKTLKCVKHTLGQFGGIT